MAEFQKSEEFGFEELPVPFDINIRAKNAGTKEVEYTILPSRETSLTEAERQDFEKMKPIEQIREKMKAKEEAKAGQVDSGGDEISAEDNPA